MPQFSGIMKNVNMILHNTTAHVAQHSCWIWIFWHSPACALVVHSKPGKLSTHGLTGPTGPMAPTDPVWHTGHTWGPSKLHWISWLFTLFPKLLTPLQVADLLPETGSVRPEVKFMTIRIWNTFGIAWTTGNTFAQIFETFWDAQNLQNKCNSYARKTLYKDVGDYSTCSL